MSPARSANDDRSVVRQSPTEIAGNDDNEANSAERRGRFSLPPTCEGNRIQEVS
jgi:hypothetical protein